MRYLFPVIIFLAACASIQPLSGGDKDETAPKILNTSTDSASINVTEQSFTFTFDEYIKTTKVSDLLIISPNQKINPEVNVKGKKLTIELKDELIPNTTYTFQFNGSVIDLNESNPLGDYKYIFSTGSYIDSLTHNGYAFDIVENGPCKNCNVQLYQSFNDSIVLKQKPDYITRTDDNGKYTLTNLPSNSFNKIILKDGNKNLLLDKDESVSISKVINTDSTNRDTSIVFPLPNTNKYKATFSRKKLPGKIQIVFNKPIKSNEPKLLVNSKTTNYSLSNTKDTISFYYKPLSDTSDIQLIIDSDTLPLKYITNKELKYTPKLKGEKNKNLVNLYLNTPIETFDSSKLTIYSDTITTSYKLIKKSRKVVQLQVDNKTETFYKVITQQGALTDILSKASKPDTLILKEKEENTSSLNLKIETTDTSSTLLLSIKAGKNVIKYVKLNKATDLIYTDIPPGTYVVTIVTDSNNNGLWDTGDFFLRKSPEKIQSSMPFEIRQNWDKELIIKVL